MREAAKMTPRDSLGPGGNGLYFYTNTGFQWYLIDSVHVSSWKNQGRDFLGTTAQKGLDFGKPGPHYAPFDRKKSAG